MSVNDPEDDVKVECAVDDNSNDGQPSSSKCCIRAQQGSSNETASTLDGTAPVEKCSGQKSNDGLQAGIGKREQIFANKFDFGDRDRKPDYNIILPALKEIKGKEWTVDELKILHECIDSYGINDKCLFYATKSIAKRSMQEIREKISEIRDLARLRQDMRVEAQKTEWLRSVIKPSKTSEIQFWSTAANVIQNRKRKIIDYTDLALQDYLGQEIRRRPTSVSTRKYFRVTDSPYARGASKKEVVDCANYYRYLHSCLSGITKFECKPLEAAIILNILEEIQKEVDDPKHESRRRILAGMFRDIQSGDLSDYDFRVALSTDEMLSLQLNPFSLMRDMLEISKEL